MMHEHYYEKLKFKPPITYKDYQQKAKYKGTCYLHSSCEGCPDNNSSSCLLIANGLTYDEIEHKPPVVDDITIKHTVLDDINFKLKIIEAKTTAIMMNMQITPPTQIEDSLIKKIAELEKQLVEAYKIIGNEGLPITVQCGGNNSYTSIKTGVRSHAEMTTTIRTNLQDISNGNPQIEQYGRMWGNWIKKNADSYFLSGLFKALTEGDK